MRDRKKISDRLPIRLDLAGEAMNQPLIEIFGNSRVIVENHKGVAQYEHCKIRVKTGNGLIEVLGNKLELVKMAREQLVIVGCIERVCLENWGK